VALSTINQIGKKSLIRVLTQLAIDKGNKISTILSIQNSVTIHISLNRQYSYQRFFSDLVYGA
jgi:hypothetical protein